MKKAICTAYHAREEAYIAEEEARDRVSITEQILGDLLKRAKEAGIDIKALIVELEKESEGDNGS